MPARSAEMLIVLAASRATMKARSSQPGNRCLKFPAKPCPVTNPIRAHIIWTAAISGHVRSAVERSLVPSCAPATEYVAMPDGSSSAAPLITPGPSDFTSNRIHRAGAGVGTKSSEHKLPTNHSANLFTTLRGAGQIERSKGSNVTRHRARRTEPHRDRKLSAAEAVETKPSKRLK